MLTEHLAEWYAECVAAYAGRPRRRWTRSQKVLAIELMLRSRPHRSDRSLSHDTGVSREFICGIRSRLVAKGQIPEGARIGMDGKRYRMAIKAEA